MKKLIIYLRDYKKESIIGPLFKMLEACFELLVPIVMAGIIDVGIKNGDRAYIWGMCALLVFFGVLGLTCSLTAQYFAAKASMGFGTALRHDVYAHMNTLSYNEMDMIGIPTLITRLTSDINQVQSGVNLVLRLFLRSPFIVVGAVFMAFTISARMTVIFLIAVPLIAVTIFAIVKVTIPIYKKVQNGLEQVMLKARENYVGTRVIRAFSRQEKEKEQFRQVNQELRGIQMYAGKISALMNPMTYVLVNLATVAILLQGGKEVYAGRLTQGEVVALVNYMTQILIALVALANLIISFTKATASAIRVNEVLDTQTTILDYGNTYQQPKAGSPKVEFDHVTFHYAKSRVSALQDMSFRAMPGQTIGVIGGTGDGKTTLVNLIPRFYETKEGAVLIDGVNVKQYPFTQLRSKIGVVQQKAVLFRGTIRQNMCFGKPDATDEEIWNALEIAQAKSFIEEKEGLDTIVAANGRNFSGGQRQRLTIARALVAKPEILILDDSSSALDYATDAALRRALREQTEDCTVFLISQRAAAVQHADQILVLDDGQLVGCGTHQELFENCEAYREICLSQFSGEEVTQL